MPGRRSCRTTGGRDPDAYGSRIRPRPDGSRGRFRMSITSPPTSARATLADLARTPGKAELIGGRIVHLMPTGHRPNQIVGEIFVSLRDYARATGRGQAYTDSMGFAIPELPSGRQSCSPDASYYDGPLPPDDMDFAPGPP